MRSPRMIPAMLVLAATALLALAAAPPAEAGRYRFSAPSAGCPSGTCPNAAAYAAPAVRYAQPAPAPVQYAPPAPAAYMPDGRPLYQPVYRVAAPAPARPVQAAAAAVATVANPLSWVNAIRARHGLHALIYDPNLSAWAAQNNAACASRGLGHHVMAGCPQIAAGTADPNYAANLWLNSPGHRVYLLSPTARYAGIDHSYGYATCNVR